MPTLKNIEELEPSALAASLANTDEEFLFFDSAGNFPKSYGAPISLIATRPNRVLKGHISEPEELEAALMAGAKTTADLYYPNGGLAGWVDYDGSYEFGVYDQFSVYSHDSDCWLERPPHDWSTNTDERTPTVSSWTPHMSQDEFEAAVRTIQEYIADGHVYQVNLAQCFSAHIDQHGHLFKLYEALRQSSPAPMSCYARCNGKEIISSSPETFLRMSGRTIETRPIKGTRPRHRDSERDNHSAYSLMTSEKEISELVMITDLLRNDLGRVCTYGSVKVEELLSLEKLAQVFHLVSTVKGELREPISHIEALRQCYPGGSITGAPKHTALNVIRELENHPRGLYTGVMGYIGFNGESQFNILIRTLIREAQTLHYHVGAGIVADSDPTSEYEETLLKAAGIRNALDEHFHK